ncbi:uncharacterized protein LOC135698232 [Ochlerotatus camptorhynchus]|uniref:uncharacterized protein LOC135698232 n=1 Tax=Ochlerotatus camptorhynchus TaxID=644619 RepID=UPI0031D7E582
MWHNVVHFIALLCLVTTASAKMEAQLERFEQVSGFHLVNATGIRVRKFNRTSWIMTGEGDLFRDFGNEYSFTMTAAYSRLGNNQFNEYPLKIPKNQVCDVVNGAYKEYQDYFLNWTNLPRVGNERLCPYPKGHYWVKDFAPDGGWIPPVVPTGYWRLTADLLDLDDNVAIRYFAYLYIKNSFIY